MIFQNSQKHHDDSQSSQFTPSSHPPQHSHRTKPIAKLNYKPELDLSDSLMQQQKTGGKRRENAKENKRIREQNRRASHKEYVNGIEKQLREKQEEVKVLSQKITSLNELISSLSYPRYCSKCSGTITECSNEEIEQIAFSQGSPANKPSMEEDEDLPDVYLDRVRVDERSLRINFGNNFLFIVITLCCLSAGCIADNADLALEPILPYKLKSQMGFLSSSSHLNKFRLQTPLQKLLNSPQFRYYKTECQSPTQHEGIRRMSDSIESLFELDLELPSVMEVGEWLVSPSGALASLSANYLLQGFMNGYNYYV